MSKDPMCWVLRLWTRIRGRGPEAQMDTSAEEIDHEEAAVPLERQPVVPADQAQGFGWTRASDLVKDHSPPDS